MRIVRYFCDDRLTKRLFLNSLEAVHQSNNMTPDYYGAAGETFRGTPENVPVILSVII